MRKNPSINGRIFKKSSYSPVLPPIKCVNVSIGKDDVLVTNFALKESSVIRFTPEEWTAFINGVKNGEFDI